MAQRTVLQLLDDLDGSDITDGGETVSFALDVSSYEIDLGTVHAAELRAALQPFAAVAGTRTGTGRRRGKRPI